MKDLMDMLLKIKNMELMKFFVKILKDQEALINLMLKPLYVNLEIQLGILSN